MANTSKLTFFHAALVVVLLIATVLFVKALYDRKSEADVHVVTRDGIITDIQKLLRLQSVAFSVDTVITASKEGSWQKLWQDEQKGLFVAHGRVLAGVDLSKISSEMVQVAQRNRFTGRSCDACDGQCATVRSLRCVFG